MIDIAVNTVPVTALVTTGVTYTMVDQEVAKRLGVTFEPKTMTVQAASGNTTEALGLSWWRYKWFGAVKTMQIVICPELSHGVLLGNGFLVDNRIRVNPMEKALEIVQDGKLRAIGPDELQFISFSSRPDVTGSANKMHESVPQKGWPTDGTTAQGTGGPAKSCAQMERQEVLHGFNVRDKDRVIRVMMRTKAKSISANASEVVTRITCGDADDAEDSEDEIAIHECFQIKASKREARSQSIVYNDVVVEDSDDRTDFENLFAIHEDIDREHRKRIEDTLWRNKKVFSRHDYGVSITGGLEMEVETVPNLEVISKRKEVLRYFPFDRGRLHGF